MRIVIVGAGIGGDLQRALADAVAERLGPDRLRLGHRLLRVEEGTDAATAVFETAGAEERVEADLVIAADGIHSAARRARYPDEGEPVWNGLTLWRGTARAAGYKRAAGFLPEILNNRPSLTPVRE